MKAFLIVIMLVLIAYFDVAESRPLFDDDDGEYEDRAWYNVGSDNKSTEKITEPTEVTTEHKVSIAQEEDPLEFSGFTKWLSDKDNSNAKSFKMLLAKALKIIKDVPWEEINSSTAATTKSNLDNNVLRGMGENGELSTQKTVIRTIYSALDEHAEHNDESKERWVDKNEMSANIDYELDDF